MALNKTRIEWVRNMDGSQGFTWNIVTGCLHGCAYCYAKKIANRFKPTKLETVELIDNDHLSNYRDDHNWPYHNSYGFHQPSPFSWPQEFPEAAK